MVFDCGNVDNGDRVHNWGVPWGFVVGQGSNRAYVNEKSWLVWSIWDG